MKNFFHISCFSWNTWRLDKKHGILKLLKTTISLYTIPTICVYHIKWYYVHLMNSLFENLLPCKPDLKKDDESYFQIDSFLDHLEEVTRRSTLNYFLWNFSKIYHFSDWKYFCAIAIKVTVNVYSFTLKCFQTALNLSFINNFI